MSFQLAPLLSIVGRASAPLVVSGVCLTRAHLFGETAVVDRQTLLTIAIVFGWDCCVICSPV
jgi:hypothetical protein